MKEQKLIWDDIAGSLQNELLSRKLSNALLICGKNMCLTDIGCQLTEKAFVGAVFCDFEPNPTYENVLQAMKMFDEKCCDAVIAVGGGSAIDIAKCVKAFYGMDKTRNFLEQRIASNTIPLLVAPATAGTGSEATSFAVIYYGNRKCSVEDSSLVPEVVFMDAALLRTLPFYQKKVTMLDAFCHCIESYWSRNSTAESKKYAVEGLQKILANYRLYFKDDTSAAKNMLCASNYAGKAINIAKTTAAHAMSYQLTKKYGLPHGHAAALCLAVVWEYTWQVAILQKEESVLAALEDLAYFLGCETIEASIKLFQDLLWELEIDFACECSREDISVLVNSVNTERLKNHPIVFDKEMLTKMYAKIIGGCI